MKELKKTLVGRRREYWEYFSIEGGNGYYNTEVKEIGV
jgi:hypothetical protein